NPSARYVKAQVDSEEWDVSREATETLEHQNHSVRIETELSGTDLLWKEVVNPMTNTAVPVLPADFVEPDNGTGIVMSVPGHAPYDYQALMDLKTRSWTSSQPEDVIRKIVPISIIRLEGFSDFPAADMVKKFEISGQKDPRLAQATKDLYSKEYHNGVMTDNAKPYSGLSVEGARQAVIKDLGSAGKMASIYELLNRPITCRCGTRVVVHVVDNQWFINYGDEEWKKKAHQCLDEMSILPEERRGEFNYTIDWLRERACARKVGLGTRLPWDTDWTIEALSDSVVYMAYSAKDLVSNHLSFYIFHHTALFAQDQWPRGIVANGFVLMAGDKMSKSLENIIPLRQAVAKFGADPLRIGTLATAELNQDTDFSETLATTIQDRLIGLISQSRKLRRKMAAKRAYSTLDRWMLSRLNAAIQAATTAMERLRVRE